MKDNMCCCLFEELVSEGRYEGFVFFLWDLTDKPEVNYPQRVPR